MLYIVVSFEYGGRIYDRYIFVKICFVGYQLPKLIVIT